MKTTTLRLSALFPVLFASALLVFNSGCVAAAVGAGASAVAWIKGELQTTVNGSYEQTVAAARKAVGQLEFAKISDSKDALQTIIVARNAADKKVEIKLGKVGSNLTSVKIRVGVFGDQPVSLAVLDRIKGNL